MKKCYSLILAALLFFVNSTYAQFEEAVINDSDKTVLVTKNTTLHGDPEPIEYFAPDGYTLVIGEGVTLTIQKTDSYKEYVDIYADVKLLSGATLVVEREAYLAIFGSLIIEGTGSTVEVGQGGRKKGSYLIVTDDFVNNTTDGTSTINIFTSGSFYVMGDALGTSDNIDLNIRIGADNEGRSGIFVEGDDLLGIHDYVNDFTESLEYKLAQIKKSQEDLPVELISFDAKLEIDYVDVTWATASEINADFFELQVSSDQRNWETLGMVEAQGNSTELTEYHYKDYTEYSSNVYYRLVQYDFDGTSEVFGPISIVFNEQLDFTSNVYPNPTRDFSFIALNNINNNNAIAIYVYNNTGQLVFTDQFYSSDKHMVYRLESMETLPEGVYYISIQNGKEVTKMKLLKE
ncbi:T9SS type A sorting domain-containing protein [Flammeovirga sp. SubArs3]|uniref:T9SS type A sorting domain-containing protein n=1 Tax=Flammeovirga sp. SubArs3 TaxID=2995316 RepID=UPI00248AA2DC|nr:T9SS type A sorting domain-containing protein [Flammeovirga sp. SubArs3]